MTDTTKPHPCENCRIRARYDRNPRALLSRLWRWHTGWCPGFKSFLATRTDEQRRELVQKYGLATR